MESAIGTFRRKGVHGASVLDIARDAGVPKGSVYNHFDNKEALAIEVLERYAGQTQAALEHGEGRAIDRLRAHLEWQLARTRSTGLQYGCLLGNFAAEVGEDDYPGLKASVRASFDTWIDGIAELITQGRRDGDVTNERPDRELAAWIVSSLEGVTALTKATGDTIAVGAFSKITLSTLGAAS